MASRIVTRNYSDGSSKVFKRRKQGRTPSGFGKPKLIRLKQEDEEKTRILKDKFGMYWNENEFIRDAVSSMLSTSVYTELLNP